jgi:hypothetical protein
MPHSASANANASFASTHMTGGAAQQQPQTWTTNMPSFRSLFIAITVSQIVASLAIKGANALLYCECVFVSAGAV